MKTAFFLSLYEFILLIELFVIIADIILYCDKPLSVRNKLRLKIVECRLFISGSIFMLRYVINIPTC